MKLKIVFTTNKICIINYYYFLWQYNGYWFCLFLYSVHFSHLTYAIENAKIWYLTRSLNLSKLIKFFRHLFVLMSVAFNYYWNIMKFIVFIIFVVKHDSLNCIFFFVLSFFFADCSISWRNLETEKRFSCITRIAQSSNTTIGRTFRGKAATHIPIGGTIG